MVYIINNIIGIGWIAIGIISIIVLIAIYAPWRFIYDLILFTVVVIVIACMFWIREGYRAVKRPFRKRGRFVDLDEHPMFI